MLITVIMILIITILIMMLFQRWTNYWLRVTAIESAHMSRQVQDDHENKEDGYDGDHGDHDDGDDGDHHHVVIIGPQRCSESTGTREGMFFTDTKGEKSAK